MPLNGTSCIQCMPGSFKNTVGSTACTLCPAGTYGNVLGGLGLDACLSCQPRASTDGLEGQSTQDSCKCYDQFYLTVTEDEDGNVTHTCVTCPIGAVCSKDRSCALHYPGMHCADGTQIKGTWAVTDNTTVKFVLTACPLGYEMHTEAKVGLADLQKCHRCLPKWQYILDPASDSCQECPPGLVCHGDDTLEPVVINSTWTRERGIFILQSCPTGYSVFSGHGYFFAEQQRCEPCGKGEDCNGTSCQVCRGCLPGYYKATVGTELCEPCPANSFLETSGAIKLSMCARCQSDSSTFGREAQNHRRSCECDGSFYRVASMQGTVNETLTCQGCPKGALCSNNECALRHQDLKCSDGTKIIGEWQMSNAGNDQFVLTSCPAGFEKRSSQGSQAESPDLQECFPCPASTYILQPQSTCQKCPAGLVCHGQLNVENRVRNSTWVVESGMYRLRKCPRGTLLENSTLECQRCVPCEVQTYALDYEYGCDRGICPQRSCLPCPQGADCRDITSFISKIDGTEWQEVYEDGILQNRIAKCPPGHTMIRDSDAANDRCKVCEIGKYKLDPTSSTTGSCLPCPAGAECSDGIISRVEAGYWMLMLLFIDGHEVLTDVSCTIEGRACALLSAEASGIVGNTRAEMKCIDLPSLGLACARKEDESPRRRSNGANSSEPLVLLCPYGACGANNKCMQNRTGAWLTSSKDTCGKICEICSNTLLFMFVVMYLSSSHSAVACILARR